MFAQRMRRTQSAATAVNESRLILGTGRVVSPARAITFFEHPGLPILERAEEPACLDKEQKIFPEYGRTPFENRLREGGAA